MNNITTNVPQLLQIIPRWIRWRDIDGKKVPVQKINAPKEWMSFDDAARDTTPTEKGGLGFVFTEDDDFGGIDLDACRNPDTGELTDWAKRIVNLFQSYTEISPSGTGVKIFAKGAPPKITPNVLPMPGDTIRGKTPQMEVYTSGRYFAVTGNVYSETTAQVRDVPECWLKLINLMKTAQPPKDGGKEVEPDITGGRNMTLTKIAGALRRQGSDYDSILLAIRTENNKRYSPPLPEKELQLIAKSVCRYNPQADNFERNKDGDIIPNSQNNVILSLIKLERTLRYNVFADRMLVKEKDQPEKLLDEKEMNHLWLEVDNVLHFRPSWEFFMKVLMHEAYKKPFHPVLDYLNGLKWDGVPRLDTWLTTYAEAADNEYTRAVGALMLLAAVRRVRTPGCKFDEMLVLESPQGKDKSTFLSVLAVEEAWFTDNLPLDNESKIVIELTAGKWIVEAADLSGMRKSDVESLKAFLSRRVEVARLAYDRLTTERPRHFVIFGTTNSQYYLKDATGNRRFWPVRVTGFNIPQLKADRDQLWAEAAARESQGESIRLNPALWRFAGLVQEMRVVDDPWEHALHHVLGDVVGKMANQEVWDILQIPVNRRTQGENVRVGDCMQKLGFERKKARIDGKVMWTYQRGTPHERKFNQIQVKFDVEAGEATAVIKGLEDDGHPEN